MLERSEWVSRTVLRKAGALLEEEKMAAAVIHRLSCAGPTLQTQRQVLTSSIRMLVGQSGRLFILLSSPWPLSKSCIWRHLHWKELSSLQGTTLKSFHSRALFEQVNPSTTGSLPTWVDGITGHPATCVLSCNLVCGRLHLVTVVVNIPLELVRSVRQACILAAGLHWFFTEASWTGLRQMSTTTSPRGHMFQNGRRVWPFRLHLWGRSMHPTWQSMFKGRNWLLPKSRLRSYDSPDRLGPERAESVRVLLFHIPATFGAASAKSVRKAAAILCYDQLPDSYRGQWFWIGCCLLTQWNERYSLAFYPVQQPLCD